MTAALFFFGGQFDMRPGAPWLPKGALSGWYDREVKGKAVFYTQMRMFMVHSSSHYM